MNYLETINLAIKAILANRLRSILTMLGIVIGVMSVIILISVVSGLQKFITDQISGFGSNLIFVIPGKVGGARGPGGVQVNRLQFSDAIDIKKKLGEQAEISSIIQKVSTAKYQNKSSKGMLTFGVEANFIKIVSALKLEQGRFFNESEQNSARKVAVIGPTVAKNLFSSSDNALNKTIKIDNSNYQVIGITNSRGSAFGTDQDNAVYLPINTARKQFGITQPNTIYISVTDSESLKSTQDKINTLLSKRLSEDDFTITNQEQALSTIAQITGVLTLALGGIAAISLLVGGIGVMNIMLVSVTERTREIGLRKALGARSKDIRNQFLIEALTLSGLGGIIGIILGVVISLLMNLVFTTAITWWSIALSFGFSMLIGIVFGVAPAIRAARLNPIQALRYE